MGNIINKIIRNDEKFYLHDEFSNHRNFVDNAFFNVNQRNIPDEASGGIVIGGSSQYIVDRWKVRNGTVYKLENGITFIPNTGTSTKRLIQTVDYKPVLNDIFTASIICDVTSIGSGSVYFGVFHDTTFRTTAPWSKKITTLGEQILSVTFAIDSVFTGAGNIGIGIYATSNSISTGTIKIKSIKLERGNICTIEEDYSLPYEIERVKCSVSTVDASDTYANKTISLT